MKNGQIIGGTEGAREKYIVCDQRGDMINYCIFYTFHRLHLLQPEPSRLTTDPYNTMFFITTCLTSF